MEHRFGRDSVMDGITSLRSLMALTVPAEDLVYIIRILLLEKAVGLRKVLAVCRTGVQRYDIGP